MKQLTDEQIKTICKTGGWDDSWQSVQFARAIGAEVLRLNGWQPIETAPMDGESVLVLRKDEFFPTCIAFFSDGRWRWSTNGAWAGFPYLWMSLPAAPVSPRATGCPDTMDDMGHFAEVEMPAFLRKQNPA